MADFKVGDRVRLKGFGNCGGESSDVEGFKARVVAVLQTPGRLEVRCDKKDWSVDVYASQCRRLKKPYRTTFWIETGTMAEFAVGARAYRRAYLKKHPDLTQVEFVEVRRK